jgi:uncharacterized protein (DUF362 family)
VSRVSLIKGNDRGEITGRSLDLIADDIKRGLHNRQVVIKPNFVSTTVELAASHVDQIRGILAFFEEFYQERIIIAEASPGETLEGFRNFGYHDLAKEYNVELRDLNAGPFERACIRDRRGKNVAVRIAQHLLDRNNYLISAAKLKTHDAVVVTLSIKNIVMGSVSRTDKTLVHQGCVQTNLNIARLAEHVWPDLAVIDGLIGMEGNGPTHGNPIIAGVAIASTDSLAADRVACEIMGVEFSKVGYLHHCAQRGMGEADLKEIDISGQALDTCISPFRLHTSVEQQYEWRTDEVRSR